MLYAYMLETKAKSSSKLLILGKTLIKLDISFSNEAPTLWSSHRFSKSWCFPGKKKSHVRKHWTQGARSGNVRGELPIQEETKRWLIFSAVYEWHIWMPIENRSKMAEITSEPCNSPSVGALIGCVIIWVLFTVWIIWF